MRIVFIIAFLANLLLIFLSYRMGPSTVAIHFGFGGVPNGWASAFFHALFSSGMSLMIFLLFYYMPYLVLKTPIRWISLPNRDYWTSEENRGRMVTMLSEHLYQFGTVTFVFMFIIGLLTLQANLSDPIRLREDIFFWVFGIYMLYVVYWIVKIMRAFRLPKEERR
jgi:hypothetical protein